MMSDADLMRSYKRYAASLPSRVHKSLKHWNEKRDGPYWQTVTIKGKVYKYHVITATDVRCFDG